MNQPCFLKPENLREYDPDTLVLETHGDIGADAAQRAATFLRKKPNGVLGMATGDTTIPMYEHFVDLYRNGLDFSQVTFFNLDEYRGLPASHAQSYHSYMQDNLFKHINACPGKIHIPNGMADDIFSECDRYERLIKSCGGIDLQVLGVGENGHIGFCEPGTPFNSRTHEVKLTELTRKNNARNFPNKEDVPTHAITMGIATILEGREIILLANGASKANAINALLMQPISTSVPITVLRRHPKVSVILSQDAFCLTQRRTPKLMGEPRLG